LENYISQNKLLIWSKAKEWQGPNIPYGDDDSRPNLIRQCFTLESNKSKINCLRKLRDQVAMNPFYQARLDRFVDVITNTYEPTDKQGTIPGNEFKETAVGEDLKEGIVLSELSIPGIVITKGSDEGKKETRIMYKESRVFSKA